MMRELRLGCAADARFAVEMRLDVLNAQVGFDEHALDFGFGRGQLALGGHVEIHAECGPRRACV